MLANIEIDIVIRTKPVSWINVDLTKVVIGIKFNQCSNLINILQVF